jgi:Protein of unknown function (DUF4054)
VIQLDVGLFRTQFPEFSDVVAYPTPMIEFWAELAEHQVSQPMWGGAWMKGVSLYLAHVISLQHQSVKTSKLGGMPGTSGGVANTKTVGGSTVGYDSVVTSEKDAGWWNLTNYGKQFIHLARMFGTKAIQIPSRPASFYGGTSWWPR